MKRQFIPDDEIILNNETDTLKTSGYAESLVKMIKKSPTNKVFTIGLFGNWGTGKSSIIKTAQDSIEKSNPKVKFIKYDAWKYVNDSFRRMFLLKVQQELRFQQTEEMSRFYQSETVETEPKTYISNRWQIIICGVLLFLVILINLLPFELKNKLTFSSILTISGLLITALSGIIGSLKLQLNKPMIFAPEQFENCFKEMISKSLSNSTWLQRVKEFVCYGENSIRDLDQIVIIIDNIDRCHHTLAYQLLTDIKTFLCDETYNLVFVIPVDDEALKKNLFTKDNNAECDKEKEEFLRKFFNVTLRIKPHQPTEMHFFAKELNQRYHLNFNSDTLALATKEFATNPRRIIQLFNNLSSELCLYETEFADKNQATICALLILREEYASYYKIIVNNPYLLFDQNKYPDDINYSLDGFMRSADIYFRQTGISDISHILTNSDAQFGSIPSEVIEGIRTFNDEIVIECLNEHDDQKDAIIDLTVKHLQDDINSRSINQMTNRLIYLSKFFNVCDLTLTSANRITVLYKDSFDKVIKSIPSKDYVCVCQFANNLDKHNNGLLKKLMLTHIGENHNNHTVVKAALSTFQSSKDAVALSKVALNVFQTNDIFTDVDYSEEQKEVLFSEDLVNTLLEEAKLDIESVKYRNLLWIFQNKKNISTEMYDKFFKTFGVVTANKKKEDTIQFLDLLVPYFNAISNKYLKDTESIKVIYENIYGQRKINGYSYKILGEYQNTPDVFHRLVNGCFEIYRITEGLLSNEVINSCYQYAKNASQNHIIKLNNEGLSITIFNQTILNDNDYTNKQSIELIRRCLLSRVNSTWTIDAEAAKRKIKDLLDNISEENVHSLILSISSDDLCRDLIISDIKCRKSGYTNNLPEDLLSLAINAFTNDNKDDFADNFDYLGIIASHGSEEQKRDIVSLCTNNLNKNEKIAETLKILEILELKSEASIKMISGALETFISTHPALHKETIESLIEKFK